MTPTPLEPYRTLRTKFAPGRGGPSRRYLGHIHGIFPCKVRKEQRYLACQSRILCLLSCLSTLARVRCFNVKNCPSSNRVVTYFQRLSSGAPVSCRLDSPHCHLQGRPRRTCHYRRLCRLRRHRVTICSNMGSDPFPRVCILS